MMEQMLEERTEIQESQLIPIADSAILQMEKAQIDTQISTAKRYPRDLQRSKKNMIAMATMDEDTAKACFFVLPRGGRSIQGESVRLAEIALSCYGNIKAGTRVVSVQDRGATPHVIVQAVTLDLENNVAITIEKRRRITKKRNKDAPDEDDINLAVNACSAIAFRDAVFKVIPKALIKPVYDAAVNMATGGKRPIESKIAGAFEKFAQMGVFEDRILYALGKETREELNRDDLVSLVGFFNAIKDEEATIENCFPKVDKKEHAATAIAEVPDLGDENKDETIDDAPDDTILTPVEKLAKSACIAEINTQKDAPYFNGILDQSISAGLDMKDCPVSMLRGIVTEMREEAAK